MRTMYARRWGEGKGKESVGGGRWVAETEKGRVVVEREEGRVVAERGGRVWGV
jgi:hypothetical protein